MSFKNVHTTVYLEIYLSRAIEKSDDNCFAAIMKRISMSL